MSSTTNTGIMPGQREQFNGVVDAALISSNSDEEAVARILSRKDELQAALSETFTFLGYELVLVDSDLLMPVAIVNYPAVEEDFVVKDNFVTGERDGVKIGWIGSNFRREFSGKTETSTPEAKLRVHELRKPSVDEPIISELGGEDTVETDLATMYRAIKKQGSGQEGDLLVNGRANIFYVRSDAGVLWAA